MIFEVTEDLSHQRITLLLRKATVGLHLKYYVQFSAFPDGFSGVRDDTENYN